MGRRDYPDAERIAKRARKLQGTGSNQKVLDDKSIDQYTQAHIIETKNRDDKAIGFGTVGNMVDKRVNIMGARPFAHVRVLGGHTAETHASGKLEPWGNAAPWIAERGYDVWDTGLQDHQLIGEAWSEVLPAPQFHGGGEYGELVAEWKRRIEDNEDRAETKEKLRVYRRDHFPIVWRYVDPISVFADPDEEGPLAEVYEFRKLSRNTIEERFPGAELEDKEEFEVIEYANDVYVATIFPESGGIAGAFKTPGKFLDEPWEHGMGINPYVRIKRGPLRANSQGYTRAGCAFQAREMSDSLDEATTAWLNGMRKEARSPVVFTLVPRIRAFLGLEDKEIKAQADGNIVLFADEQGREGVERYPTPTVNEQLPGYIGLVGSQADRAGANVPQFMGYGPSGESAVHGAHSRESAITGELEMPVRHLEEGFAAIVERHFRCVIALDKMLPEGADADMRKVVVVAEDSKHGAKEIAVTAIDVRNHERRITAKLQKNLPVNMGLNVQNLLQLTDKDNPKIDDNQARERFLNDPNPQETEERLFQQRLRRAGEDAYVESYAQTARLIVDEFSEEKMAKIAEKMMKVPGALQQAVLGEMGAEDGSRLMENMARGAANIRGTGVPQGLSQLQGMPQEEAFVG